MYIGLLNFRNVYINKFYCVIYLFFCNVAVTFFWFIHKNVCRYKIKKMIFFFFILVFRQSRRNICQNFIRAKYSVGINIKTRANIGVVIKKKNKPFLQGPPSSPPISKKNVQFHFPSWFFSLPKVHLFFPDFLLQPVPFFYCNCKKKYLAQITANISQHWRSRARVSFIGVNFDIFFCPKMRRRSNGTSSIYSYWKWARAIHLFTSRHLTQK